MICNLAVHPDYRRLGIGKALLEAAITLAKQAQLRRLEAWTRDDAPHPGLVRSPGLSEGGDLLACLFEG